MGSRQIILAKQALKEDTTWISWTCVRAPSGAYPIQLSVQSAPPKRSAKAGKHTHTRRVPVSILAPSRDGAKQRRCCLVSDGVSWWASCRALSMRHRAECRSDRPLRSVHVWIQDESRPAHWTATSAPPPFRAPASDHPGTWT